MKHFKHLLVVMAAALTPTLFTAPVSAQNAPAIGIVVMHGKGGRPDRHVKLLAEELERKGWLVANLEMPWSGRREYDVDVAAAEKEVTAALDGMRAKGVKKCLSPATARAACSHCITPAATRSTV